LSPTSATVDQIRVFNKARGHHVRNRGRFAQTAHAGVVTPTQAKDFFKN